jgi:hypothetical protein
MEVEALQRELELYESMQCSLNKHYLELLAELESCATRGRDSRDMQEAQA